MYLGRAPRTKETLPDFLKWRRVTRPPLVFRGLTGSQRTPGFWGVTEPFSADLLRQTFSVGFSPSNLLCQSSTSDLLYRIFSFEPSPSYLLRWTFSSLAALNLVRSTPSWNTSEALDNVALPSASDRIKYIFITSLMHMTYML